MGKSVPRLLSALILITMLLGAIVIVYPYAYMVGSSLKTRGEFARDKQSLIPPRYQVGERLRHAGGKSSALDWPGADWSVLRNYADAIRYGKVTRFLANSFVYAVNSGRNFLEITG
jgi:ABC-type glycerol-3-phosphate transport system permease component